MVLNYQRVIVVKSEGSESVPQFEANPSVRGTWCRDWRWVSGFGFMVYRGVSSFSNLQ